MIGWKRAAAAIAGVMAAGAVACGAGAAEGPGTGGAGTGGPGTGATVGPGDRALARFMRLDANSDGRVTRDEFAARIEARAEKRAARAERLLARADTDGDGALSAAEYAPLAGRLRARAERKERGRTPPGFARLDRDGDGRLTAAELAAWGREGPGPGLRRFEAADADGDGAMTRAEFAGSRFAARPVRPVRPAESDPR